MNLFGLECLLRTFVLIFAFFAVACTSPQIEATPSVPTMTAAPSVTGTPPPISTATIEPTRTPVPTETPLRRFVIEPLFTAPRLRPESWSPDGKWLATWFSQGDDRPAELAFVGQSADQICLHSEVIAQDLWSGDVSWQEGNALVVSGGRNLSGVPCGEFTELDGNTNIKAALDRSPGGRYLAETTTMPENQLLHNLTIITETSTGEVIVQVAWDASVHAMGTGPSWLGEDLYLLGQTMNQGVLYVFLPDARTGDLVSDMLALEVQPAENKWFVFSHTDDKSGVFHILLQWWDGLERQQLVLYHGESGEIERIPFYRARPFGSESSAFSPDGEFLLVGDPVDQEESEQFTGDDVWLRPVDPPGNPARLLAEGMGGAFISPKVDKIAFYDQRSVYLYDFPGAVPLNRWVANSYMLIPVGWSADGNRLALIGNPIGAEKRMGLFIVMP